MLRHGTVAPAGCYSGSDNLTRVRELSVDRSVGLSHCGATRIRSADREFLVLRSQGDSQLPSEAVAALVSASTPADVGVSALAWCDATRLPWAGTGPLPLVQSTAPPVAAVPVSIGTVVVESAKLDAIGGFATDFGPFYRDVDLCLRFHRAGYRMATLSAPGITIPELVVDGAAPPRWRRLWGSYLTAWQSMAAAPSQEGP